MQLWQLHQDLIKSLYDKAIVNTDDIDSSRLDTSATTVTSVPFPIRSHCSCYTNDFKSHLFSDLQVQAELEITKKPRRCRITDASKPFVTANPQNKSKKSCPSNGSYHQGISLLTIDSTSSLPHSALERNSSSLASETYKGR